MPKRRLRSGLPDGCFGGLPHKSRDASARHPITVMWPYRDLCNSQYPVLGLASCSRPAGQGPKLPQKLLQNWPKNCPIRVAMTSRKGRGGGPPGHPAGAPEKLPNNCKKHCPKLMDCYKGPDTPITVMFSLSSRPVFLPSRPYFRVCVLVAVFLSLGT